jgi:hypothetical protein
MVENPEQAAYIIQWTTLDDLKNFQSSPACAEFLRNLPEDDNSGVSIESGSALRHLSLDDASSSSRFLTLKHPDNVPTFAVEGRVTLTTFSVPRKVDDVYGMWRDNFKSVFRVSNFVPGRIAVWFFVLAEDHWVDEKFGKLEQTQQDNQGGRTIFCHFHLWRRPGKFDRVRGYEEASAVEETSAADPQARESWKQAKAQVMPPAAACEQERWDIREVPRFYPPEPEGDPEDIAWEQEKKRLLEEPGYLQFHGFEPVGQRSQ